MTTEIKLNTKLEFFCGTGGVGKTTLSASRAHYLANVLLKKVVLITIDPSLRLKDFFQLNETGKIVKSHGIDILLFSPTHFLNELFHSKNLSVNDFRPIKIVSGSHGGLNEILSLVKISQLISENLYEYVIVDTAPGEHFLDFLEGLEKIKLFFSPSLSLFLKMTSALNPSKFGFMGELVQSITQSGIDKTFTLIEKLTGPDFLQEFRKTLAGILSLKDIFLQSLELFDDLKQEDRTTFFLVTTIEHDKWNELLEMRKSLKNYSKKQFTLLLNQSALANNLTSEIKNIKNKEWKEHCEILLLREESWNKEMFEHFHKILSFPRIFKKSQNPKNMNTATNTTLEILSTLTEYWQKGENK